MCFKWFNQWNESVTQCEPTSAQYDHREKTPSTHQHSCSFVVNDVVKWTFCVVTIKWWLDADGVVSMVTASGSACWVRSRAPRSRRSERCTMSRPTPRMQWWVSWENWGTVGNLVKFHIHNPVFLIHQKLCSLKIQFAINLIPVWTEQNATSGFPQFTFISVWEIIGFHGAEKGHTH